MVTWDDPADAGSVLRILFEPLHTVMYFTPEARAALEEAGLRGYWRGYFGGRAAPMGPVGAEPVISAFYGFAPRMVARALPDVWSRATPEQALRARATGARAALNSLFGPEADADPDIAEAARLLRRAAEAAPIAGRPLAAANASLPWPEQPLDQLWHAATLLREHRGDGHIAALLVEGVGPCESLVLRASIDNDRAVLQPARGWTDEEWDAAAARLTERGWLDAQGSGTASAREALARVEARTDVLAADPWRELGAEDSARLAELLLPRTKIAFDLLPKPNPIGLVTLPEF